MTMVISYCWLSALFGLFWMVTSHQDVIADKNRLPVQLEDEPELFSLDLNLLDSHSTHRSRNRRYVIDERPLDEYVQQKRQLTPPEQNLNIPPAPSRQTKEIKFVDGKSAVAQGTMSNSAARGASQVIPTTSTSAPLPAQIPDSVNKPVIVGANFGNGVPTSQKPTEVQTPASPKPIDDDLAIIDEEFPGEVNNATLKMNNITKKEEDHHIYYNSSFVVDYHIGQSYWVDMNSKHPDVKVNSMLSKSHRRAATVKLSFDFPFYGHYVRNVTIATGGFLYTGEYVHSWLAATQYIAPLMANFDTSISNDSFIKYVDNGTAFTVQWDKVVLQDKPETGEFTFQTTLHASGDIVFVYQNVPVIIRQINDDQHPVKVGLSDAYIIDRTIFFVRRKTIYEYHRVNFDKEDIKNWTTIYLSALPTCIEKKDCNSCVQHSGFECKWCPSAGRCSTGMDRRRQDWVSNDCEVSPTSALTSLEQCGELSTHESQPSASAAAAASPDTGELSERAGGSSYLGAAFAIVLVAGVAIWALYAYSNPHSYSGQILIRYRPSQWSWRRGEARYTAATIHM